MVILHDRYTSLSLEGVGLTLDTQSGEVGFSPEGVATISGLSPEAISLLVEDLSAYRDSVTLADWQDRSPFWENALADGIEVYTLEFAKDLMLHQAFQGNPAALVWAEKFAKLGIQQGRQQLPDQDSQSLL